jgi:hypothetical protein
MRVERLVTAAQVQEHVGRLPFAAALLDGQRER